MTKKEFSKLADAIMDLVPGGVNLRDRIIIFPVESIVRGLLFGSSNDRTAFYPNAFFVPLFAPTPVPVLHLSFGFRLRTSHGTEGWYSTDPNLVAELRRAVTAQAVPFLKKLDTDAGVLEELEARARIGNPYALEAFAYALVRAGEKAKALKTMRATREALDGIAPWQKAMAMRCDEMEQALDRSIEFARQLLDRWERDTRAQLEREWTR